MCLQHGRRHLVAVAVVARRGGGPHRGAAVAAVRRAARGRPARHAQPAAAAADAATARAPARHGQGAHHTTLNNYLTHSLSTKLTLIFNRT